MITYYLNFCTLNLICYLLYLYSVILDSCHIGLSWPDAYLPMCDIKSLSYLSVYYHKLLIFIETARNKEIIFFKYIKYGLNYLLEYMICMWGYSDANNLIDSDRGREPIMCYLLQINV